MKYVGLFLCVILLSGVLVSNAYALTKEQSAAQKAERERILLQMREPKTTDVELTKPYLNVITLETSKICNVINSTSCPKFTKLVPYDTTNQKYVGKLTNETRLKPFLNNPSVIYKDVKDTVICLNCPWDIYKNAKHVIIDRPFIYKDDSIKIVNNTRYEYHNWYDENCSFVRTTLDHLDQAITYLKSNCTQKNYNEKVTIKPDLTKHDISTSKSWKYQQWLKEAKKLAGTNCIKSKEC